jgi:outer membrane protein assembly factor BamD
MMMQPRHALCLAAALMMLAGCSRSPTIETAPAQSLYEQAVHQLDQANWTMAISYLEFVEARFPFSNEARQAQLDLIYAYYRNREPEAAIDAAEQFVRENPTHPRVDYALYMQGLANFDAPPNTLDRWMRVDLNRRPPQGAMRSYTAFQELAQRFPDSEYVPDARERMIYLRNRLAAYELHVARHYMRRQAYVAALNRARFALETYAGAPQQREALELKLEAYERLGMQEMASNTRDVLAANWPGRY